MTAYTEERLGRLAETVLELAEAVRDEGPDTVAALARKALGLVDGDVVAALTVAACLVDIDRPVVRWWQPGNETGLEPCGSHAAFMRHWRNDEPIDDPCREANRAYARDTMARQRRRNRGLAVSA